jgi:hypothetical protein
MLSLFKRPKPQPVVCEVCDGTDDIRKAPLMTGVPFDAPADHQRYVCGACVVAWYESGATTREQIRLARGMTA